MNTELHDALEALLDARIVELHPVGGGSIASSHRLTLQSGERCFVKCYDDADPRIAHREARGLEWLREANAIAVARVRAVSNERPLLVLDWVEAGRPAVDFDERLGRGLAELHLAGADGFGFVEDNFIGSLPQRNHRHDDWPSFYAHERLAPLIRRAHDAGALPNRLALSANSLLDRLPELCGPAEPPARLHGDLWSGNSMIDPRGEPLIIDPAVYGGHREVDLAMMRLFGGFSARVFDAYHERTPLSPGAAERVHLYQLYPLLVHVNLFGGSYVGSLEAALQRYA